jgi:cellulose biosynthesis protein BcsQ
VLAASTVLIPMLAYAVAADRLDGPLERVREWIERQHAALTAVILALVGIVLLYQGIRAF